jgi:outer membrane protein assembly factor BamB
VQIEMMRKFVVVIILLLIFTAIMPGFNPVADKPAKKGTRGESNEPYTFRGNLKRTGAFDSTVPQNNTLLWSFETGSKIESSAVIVSGKVYFGAEDGYVYCVNATSGSEIWSFRTNNEVDSTPAVVDGVVYVGSADRKFYAIDAKTGDELWNYSLSGPFSQIVSSPAVAHGLVFFGSKDYDFYALNITTHGLEWTFPTGNEIWASPAVDGPYVYIGSKDGVVYCLWANNGTQKWNFSSDMSKRDHGIYGSPMISNGRLYIGSEDHNLYCLNSTTGELIWNFTSPYFIYSSATIHDETIFIHTEAIPFGQIYAIPDNDPNNDGIIDSSEVIWSFQTEDWEGGSSPTVADGKVLVGSTNGKLYCLNESNGEELWNLTTGRVIVSSPTVSNGRRHVRG